tara:strand:- start:945 stop:1526 length:582 start_codon:yes stop_codon:yes gene_type:complete
MKYSIIINSLKYFLISISIVILIFLAIKITPTKIDVQSTVSFENESFASASQILSKPLFMGLDKKKKPFKISALRATRYNDNQDEFNLEKPLGEIETNSEKFFMNGDFGVYNKKSQLLTVEGDVNLTDKKSMEFKTSKAFFDFKKEVLFSNTDVIGKKKHSLIKAEGFKIFNKENRIIFTGKSKLILRNDKNK